MYHGFNGNSYCSLLEVLVTIGVNVLTMFHTVYSAHCSIAHKALNLLTINLNNPLCKTRELKAT